MQRYQSAHDVLESVRNKLASAATATAFPGDKDVLQQVTDILSRGRGYSWVGIYLAVEDNSGAAQAGRLAQAESTSNAAGSGRFPEDKSEMVVPIRIGARTLGMIDVESGHVHDLGSQERALLGQVAAALAQYLTTGPGKLQRRHAREREAGAQAEGHPQKGPQPARPERSRAAAGEHSTR
jgi:hypothetical protein